MCVRSWGRAGSGSRAGGLGPEVGRQVQVGAPRGFSALMASMTHLCPHSHLDAARCPHPEPRRRQPTLPPTLRGSRTCERSGWTDPLFPPDPAGLCFRGVWGSAACWKPGAPQPGHFRSVLADHRAALHEVPGSALGSGQHVAIEPGHGFVLPVEMFSDTAFIPFGDVGEVWSPVMISSSRKVQVGEPPVKRRDTPYV